MKEGDNDVVAVIKKKDESNTFILFGRDIAEIPCFRDSFLYGISGGIGGGLLAFLFTSRPRLAMHSGMAIYVNVTLGYWLYCRYTRAVDKFNAMKVQDIFQQAAVLEGTKEGPKLENDKAVVDV